MSTLQSIQRTPLTTLKGGDVTTKVTINQTPCCPKTCQISGCCIPRNDHAKKKLVSRTYLVLTDESIDFCCSTLWTYFCALERDERAAEVAGIQCFKRFLSEQYGPIASKAAPCRPFDTVGTAPLNFTTMIADGSYLRLDHAISIERSAMEISEREIEIVKAAKHVKYYRLYQNTRSNDGKENVSRDRGDEKAGGKAKEVRTKPDPKRNQVLQLPSPINKPKEHRVPALAKPAHINVTNSSDISNESSDSPLVKKIRDIVQKLTSLASIKEPVLKEVVASITQELISDGRIEIHDADLYVTIFDQLEMHGVTFDRLVGGELFLEKPLANKDKILFILSFIRELMPIKNVTLAAIDGIIIKVLKSMGCAIAEPYFLSETYANGLKADERAQLEKIVNKLDTTPIADLSGEEIALFYKHMNQSPANK